MTLVEKPSGFFVIFEKGRKPVKNEFGKRLTLALEPLLSQFSYSLGIGTAVALLCCGFEQMHMNPIIAKLVITFSEAQR